MLEHMPDIYVDADACPVKNEAVRVAQRHGLSLYMVSNSGLRRAMGAKVYGIMVDNTPDAADHWIVEHAKANDIVITADILLANRCLEQQVWVIGPNGKRFNINNIGTALALRELSAHLRETGESKGYNPSFTPRDRSQFLQELEGVVQSAKRLIDGTS